MRPSFYSFSRQVCLQFPNPAENIIATCMRSLNRTVVHAVLHGHVDSCKLSQFCENSAIFINIPLILLHLSLGFVMNVHVALSRDCLSLRVDYSKFTLL
jgi:hypothetical protein